MECEPYLLVEGGVPSIDEWLGMGGGSGLDAARRLGPDDTIEELTLAGLRGRGGAGFPTGRKWAGVRAQTGTHRYVVVNGAEGEPATYKDRAILRSNPYQVVEGAAIASLTIGAREVFIGVKAGFTEELSRLRRAVDEMQEAGLAGDVPMSIVAGPDEYLFGEEKALLEVIEGRPPMPRILPVFEHGLFAVAPQMGWEAASPEPGQRERDQSNPTVVNNVETLANVAHILARGATWYRSMGTSDSTGHAVCTVVGDVARPSVAEIEMGRPLGEVIEEVGGGLHAGRRVKAVLSGVSNPVLTAAALDSPVSYEGMKAAGSALGAVGFAVYDDSACMVEVAYLYSRFLHVESCGQCPPCKLGTGEITERLDGIRRGRGSDADIGVIGARLATVTDANRCYLGTEEQQVIGSFLREFPEEFAAHLEGDCPLPRGDLITPKLTALAGGTATYDLRHRLKRPDWTYEDAASE